MSKKNKHPKKFPLIDSDAEDSSGETSDLVVETILKINEKYAKEYEEKKQREELGNLEEKYALNLKKSKSFQSSSQKHYINDVNKGENVSNSSSDSEDGVEEDEVGDMITPELDAQILKTISSLRNKSSEIYDPSKEFFDEDSIKESKKKWMDKKLQKKKIIEKSMSLKEYHHKMLMDGFMEDSESEEENNDLKMDEKDLETAHTTNISKDETSLTFVEQQEALKNSLKSAIHSLSNDESGSDTNELMFLKKSKSRKDVKMEEDEYRKFLVDHLDEEPLSREAMAVWLSQASHQRNESTLDTSTDRDESFLANYILNRGWIDKAKKKELTESQFNIDDSEDEEQLEKAEDFENAYNFRFEQEGGTRLVSHARHVEGSVRKEDLSRKKKRKEKMSKKIELKQRETEELKRLKNLKKIEIQKKLNTIERIAGTTVSAFNVEDFEGDFDPEQFDKKMAKIFDEEYYRQKENSDDDGFLQVDNEFKDILEENVEDIRKRVNVDLLDASKRRTVVPDFDDKSLNRRKLTEPLAKKLEDEYFNLHYEDKIEGIPTRFRYSSVMPSTFGLDLMDILQAEDTLLNRHVSLKKLAPYRSVNDQEEDIKLFSKKKRLRKFIHDLNKIKKEKNVPTEDKIEEKD